MSKFKEGDRVRLLEPYHGAPAGTIVTVQTITFAGTIWCSDNPACGGKCCLGEGDGSEGDANLELVTKKEYAMENVKVGDILVSDEADYTKEVIFITRPGKIVTIDSDDECVDKKFASDLVDYGFSIKGSEKEMTVAEIAKALGHPVKVIEG